MMIKQPFDDVEILAPIPNAPRRSDYRTKEEHLNATHRAIDDHFSKNPMDPQKHKCGKCKDKGWISFKREEKGQLLDYAEKCACPVRGSWSMDLHGFPDFVEKLPRVPALDPAMKAIKNRERCCFILEGAPGRVLQAGLTLATEIADGKRFKPFCISAKDAPDDYDSDWNPPIKTADCMMIRDVDRRLSPAQVQRIGRLIDSSPYKSIVIISEPLKNWPKTNAWAALGLSLQARSSDVISV